MNAKHCRELLLEADSCFERQIVEHLRRLSAMGGLVIGESTETGETFDNT